jgi:hypothetical protein
MKIQISFTYSDFTICMIIMRFIVMCHYDVFNYMTVIEIYKLNSMD